MNKRCNDWQWRRLGDVASVAFGQSPPSYSYNKEGKGLPFFQGKADFGKKHPTPRVWCGVPTRKACLNDILISLRAPVGPTNVANVECGIGRGLAAITPHKDVLEMVFLLFYLRHTEAILAQQGTGSTFDAIGKKVLLSHPVPVPSLDEQKRIVEQLDKQMAAAELTKAAAKEQLEAIEAMPAALLRQVFGDLSTPPPYWKLLKMREIFLFNAPKPKKFFRLDNSQTTFIPMKSVSGISGEAVAPQTVPYAKVKRGYTFFMEGDILFAKITPCMQNGKHFIAKKLIDKIGFGSTEFHVLRPTEKVLAEWGHFYLRQKHILKSAVNYFTGSVGQQRLPQTFIENLLIPVPPFDEQRRIVKQLKKQMAEIDAMRLSAEERAIAVQAMPAALLRQTFGELS